jgi:hypothetical protein
MCNISKGVANTSQKSPAEEKTKETFLSTKEPTNKKPMNHAKKRQVGRLFAK